ncbi:MAG: membrane protein [Bacteroidetes bacterium OLB12]|nr:MAG: membrane protein [Bacteroidetes bacterium OLB12]HNR74437.1 type IX secretion system membrane protein PorP/SprF [Cyclobacteriaceae bacterium]HNU43387.1 type IX secretion system membrane protein PorP/SprF [Cyclobacteriaceae bacterium]
MKTITTLACLLLATLSFAQQDPIYSQYLFNPLLVNPAYAGLSNRFNGSVGYRTQWMGLEGQPQTINASLHTSLVQNKVGLGLLVVNDRIGSMNTTEINTAFAYKLQLENKTVSFGMQAGVQNFNSSLNGVNPFDKTDNLFLNGERGTRVNVGTGIALASEKYFVSFSVPRLLPTTFKSGGQKVELYNQHLYLMGAYIHYLNEHIRLKPAVLLRAVKGAPASIDVAFNVNFNAIHTAGIFTRNFNTYGLLLQTLLKEQYRFGYVFEVPTGKSVGTNFTTHEIVLGIQLSSFSFHDRSLSNF